jgi:signal transduction histidine kinase
MLRLREGSIRRRLTVVATVASSVAVLCAGTAFVVYDVGNYRRVKVRRLGLVAEIVAYNAASSLEFRDEESASRTLAALAAEPRIVCGGLYSQDGVLFASYQRPGPGGGVLPAISPGASAAHSFSGGTLRISRPVLLEGSAIGSVLLVGDLQDVTERVRDYTLMVAVVALGAVVLSGLASARIQTTISGPLLRLADLARTVSRDKDYSVRAAAEGGEVGELVDTFNAMLGEIQRRDAELNESRRDLERRVEERTADLQRARVLLEQRAQELETANRELESFSYSVSHDLRAPLRAIDGFSLALLEDYGASLDDQAQRHLDRVRKATQTMGLLIDDLLKLARVARAEIRRDQVDLAVLGAEVVASLREAQPGREVEFVAAGKLRGQGDPRLLKVVLENLLGNAWKFTSKQPRARIELGATSNGNGRAFYVKDDGAGFDMAFAEKLFGAFQRLHSVNEFPGTGIGLATCARIVHRHGGRIWAESEPGKGAAFFFTLGGGEA